MMRRDFIFLVTAVMVTAKHHHTPVVPEINAYFVEEGTVANPTDYQPNFSNSREKFAKKIDYD